MKPLYLFEEGGVIYAKDALGNVVPVDFGGGTPVPMPTPAEGVFYPAIDIPWSQGQGISKVLIGYYDAKVVSQAYRIGGLAWVMHTVVLQSQCASHLPEPPVEGGEWEWKMPWPTLARGYWTGTAEIYTASKTHYLVGAIHLRTAIEDGLEVCYASIRVPQPAEQKKGVVNKRSPWADPWGNGFYYKFLAIYPCK